jgi:hypothetical protein
LRRGGKELIYKESTASGRVITRETGTCAPEQRDLEESACMAKNAEGQEIPSKLTNAIVLRGYIGVNGEPPL